VSAFSDYTEGKTLDLLYNGVAFTAPATYVALHTADPTDAGTGTEVSGGSYARVLVNANGGASPTWNTAVVDGIGKLVDNTHNIEFPTATGSWGTITHVAIWDAVTGGNLIQHGALDASVAIASGQIFRFNAGNLNWRCE